jgi:Tfp pilus assembly protein PilF
MNRSPVIVTLVTGLTVQAAGVAQQVRTASEYYQAGSKAFVDQRFDAAIDALNRSLALEPKQLAAVRLLGLTYQLAGQLDQAELQFQNARRLAPKDVEAWFYLGRLYYVRNFFDKALPALQTALKYGPDDARIRECLALTLEATGDWTGAEREYQQAMRLPSKQPGTVALNYGAMLLKVNRPVESEPFLVKAAGLMPAFWQARFELAKLYCQTERFEAALRELKAALETSPKPEEAARTHGLMAVAYGRLGRYEEARLAAEAAAK